MDQPHYLGHRKRLKEKLLQARPGAMADYELLELVLFSAIPRGDVKPLAKELIKRLGSFAAVINASPQLLYEIKGVGESVVAALRVIKEATVKVTSEILHEKPILQSWRALIDYTRASMGHIDTEQFRVLYLNSKNMIIADDLQETGTNDHTPVYPREIVKRALFLEASAVILIHNHPSGDTKASNADIEMTKKINEALKTVNVELHDHMIISDSNHFSFKSNGLL